MSLRFAIVLLLGAAFPGSAQHSTNPAAEAKVKQLQAAPGLKVELVAAEPLLQNPVAFSVDERGRFFVAETHRWGNSVFDITKQVTWLLDDLSCRTVADREAHLHRLFPGTNFATLTNHSELVRLVEDTDGDGRADKSTVLADGFNAATAGPAAGILARKGEVWFACLPELWRLELGAGSLGKTAPRTPAPSPISHLLSSNFGVHISVSGHDLHGLVFGPDGRLYFSLGDRGFELRPGMKHPGFSAEYLRRIAPDTGAVFRCQPDGSELEVFCIGLRNPQGLAFDALGNLFTVDNDTAGPDKPRLLHLVEGGDYGWRISYQHMKNFGPWVTEELWRGGAGDILPWSGEVAQGPAGLAFYPGTGLPDRYTNHFFICDFPGGVWSFSLKPRGASFELAAREKFLWNLLPTHAAFGPDGALYVSDWVEGWGQPEKGRLYRVSDPAQAGSAQLAETKRLLSEGMEKRSEAELARLLAHDSMQVRLAAQFELAARTKSDRDPAVRELVQVALKSTNLYARLHAIWGLGQIGEKLKRDELTNELVELTVLLDDTEPIIRAKACSLFQKSAFMNAQEKVARLVGDPEPLVKRHAIDAIALAVLPHIDWRMHQTKSQKLSSVVQEKLFVLKVRLTGSGFPLRADGGFTHPVAEARSLFSSASRASDDLLFHGGVKFLTSTWADTAARRGSAAKMDYSYEEFVSHKDSAVRLGALRALRRLSDPALAQFLRDPDPRLVLEAARAINDAGIEPAYPALAALVGQASSLSSNFSVPAPAVGSATKAIDGKSGGTPDLLGPLLRRALNAHYRLGHATNAQALAEFAVGPVGQASSLSSNFSVPAPAAPASAKEKDGESGRMPDLLHDALCAEALFLLGAWEVLPATPGNVPVKIARVDGHGSTPLVNPENWPGWFDRVCGLWRPLPPRDASAARDALRPHLASLLAPQVGPASSRPSIVPVPAPAASTATKEKNGESGRMPDLQHATQLAAIAAVEKLALTEAAPHLAALVKAPSSPAPVRVAALRTLGSSEFKVQSSKSLSDSVTLALADADAVVRREAVKLAGVANPGTAIPILERIITEKTDARLVQSALSALGDLPGPAADNALVWSLQLLQAKMWQPESELDLLEAAAKRPAGPVAEALKGYLDSRSKADALAPFRATLAGGDAEAGKRIFFEHVGGQCLRCHAVRGEGGIVGPGLTGVGKRLTREQLLESIVFPNKAIAVGFENATIVLKSGANHSGLVKSETATELVLDSPEDGKLTLKKADIEKRIRGLSAMPEGLDKLMTRRELRDLVEYLSTLK